MANSEKHEEYFWERYQTLVRTENNSSLHNLLSGVGPIESFSDVRTVLQMYDSEAQKTKPNYWENRFSSSVEWQERVLVPIKLHVTCYDALLGKPVKKEDVAHDVVCMMEAMLAGEYEDVTNQVL